MKKIAFSELDIFSSNENEDIYECHKWNFNDLNHLGRFDDLLEISKLDFFCDQNRKFLEKNYESLLIKYSERLNKFHGKEINFRNWEILIGPWLRISLFGFYDRWETVQELKNKNQDMELNIRKTSCESLVPDDFKAFDTIFYNDAWNSQIYYLIFLSKALRINLKDKLFDESLCSVAKKQNTTLLDMSKKIFKLIVINCFNLISSIFFKFYSLIFTSNLNIVSGVPNYFKFAYFLLRNFGMFSQIIEIKNPKSESKVNLPFRLRSLVKLKRIQTNKKEDISFERAADVFLSLSIPKSYLEDFKRNEKFCEPIFKNREIDNIFSTTEHWNNDIFKHWLMLRKNKDKKTKIVIWQHGGTYGTTYFPTHQEYLETKLFDFFLTWGWENSATNILPFLTYFHISSLDKAKKKLEKKSKVLVVATRIKKYSKGDPWDSDFWNIDYVKTLKKIILKKPKYLDLHLRMHPSQERQGVKIKEYLKKIGNFIFDDERDLINSIQNSNLVIITQNSTTLLQSLSMNVPTVCYWNTKINPFRQLAENDFRRLEGVNIFFRDIDELTSFVDKNSKEINEWWDSKDVQNERIQFCKKYASKSLSSSDKTKIRYDLKYKKNSP